ncbi:hypothetical protein J437_LFUL009483 [Ladona fulva]|uniref:Rho-GAP domain-containing protein n=1 Tax=Ladona fulva TaxID=123851 RepID=A0A8K0JZD1_LADFU|nr:hypothetical protein J437_LFUL009483 [Ladona fulva]
MCFPSHAVMDFSRAGSAHIKEGISGKWCQGWLLLYQRTLFYFASGMSNSKEANLQHARCISLTKEEDGGGSSILVDTQGGCAIYIRPISFESGSFFHSASIKFLGSKNTVSAWKSALKSAAVESGPQIAEQQLTVDNIPVIVDKCINFIYAHGGMSEGIYRRSGSNNAVTRLLTAFKRDAWDVQLIRRDFTEYDVASVLKRFFRDLPEPLLTATLHDEFCEVAAHLSYVHGQRERNLMPVENLAAIWGPTLMHVEGNDTLGWSRRESEVVMDLVSLFSSIFDVSPEEEEREKQMQEVLERYHRAASGSPSTSMPASPNSSVRASPDTTIAFPGGRMPPSGDLKIWVHILPSVPTTDKGNNCIHITLSPQKLAWQVAMELCQKLGLDKKKEWGLEEHVLGGALIRPLHPTERVLDAVLRWGYWDEMDRRDNFIALGPATLYTDVAPLIMSKTPPTVNGKLRFADTRAKSFKTFTFEFSQAKLSYYKDERGSNKIADWKVEDILWYLGHEPKRNPQTRWSITFINRHKKVSRSKEAPFFGNTIAGTSSEEKLRWATALLLGEHPDGLSYYPRTDLMQ